MRLTFAPAAPRRAPSFATLPVDMQESVVAFLEPTDIGKLLCADKAHARAEAAWSPQYWQGKHQRHFGMPLAPLMACDARVYNALARAHLQPPRLPDVKERKEAKQTTVLKETWITCVASSPNGSHVAMGEQSRRLRVIPSQQLLSHDRESEQKLGSELVLPSGLRSVEWHGDRLVACGQRGDLSLVQVGEHKLDVLLERKLDLPGTARWFTDRQVAVAAGPGIDVFDLGAEKITYQARTPGKILSLGLSAAHPTCLILGTKRSGTRVVDTRVADRQECLSRALRQKNHSQILANAYNHWVALVGDNDAVVYDLRSSRTLIDCSMPLINDVKWHPSMPSMLAFATDENVVFLDVGRETAFSLSPRARAAGDEVEDVPQQSLAFHPTIANLLLAGNPGAACVWDVAARQTFYTIDATWGAPKLMTKAFWHPTEAGVFFMHRSSMLGGLQRVRLF